MLFIRNKWLFCGGLLLWAGWVAYNHGAFPTRRAPASATNLNLNVRSESDAPGHRSIGIDEKSLADAADRFLFFKTLEQWQYAKDAPTPVPAPVQKLSGQKFSAVGFMYPLESGDKVKTFCLLRSTQTCCYGPRPQYNQYLLVESAQPISFDRMAPILVKGTFFAEANPAEGFIYRMAADSVQKAEEDVPQLSPEQAAKTAHLPLLDFAALASVRETKIIPPALKELDGKRVVVAGYCNDRDRNQLPRLMVGKDWWDGNGQGVRPTLFNSLFIHPADASQVPPLWKPYQTFAGTLRVTPDSTDWRRQGVLQLTDARRDFTTPASVGVKSALLWAGEVAALLALLAVTLGKKRHEPGKIIQEAKTS